MDNLIWIKTPRLNQSLPTPPQSLDAFDSAVLRKRGMIAAPFHLMKSQFDLEHTRHRSKIGLLTTIFAALTLYALMLVNGYKSGIQQILKPIELKSAA